jgi:hypothetical protein
VESCSTTLASDVGESKFLQYETPNYRAVRPEFFHGHDGPRTEDEAFLSRISFIVFRSILECSI